MNIFRNEVRGRGGFLLRYIVWTNLFLAHKGWGKASRLEDLALDTTVPTVPTYLWYQVVGLS